MTDSKNLEARGTRTAWRKSTYSGGSDSQCVEVADVSTPSRVAVRDSKDPDGPALLFTPEAFAAFVGAVSSGEFDV